MSISSVPTTPFEGQRPGTSGLRKKTRIFMQPNYLENFVRSVFDVLRQDEGGFAAATLVLGGDGRYHNRTAIQIILGVAAGNRFRQVLVGRNGILSTPAMSAVIRRRGALGGLVLSASHNPGGIDADFGIKYNARNGGPAPEALTERIYGRSMEIDGYYKVEHAAIDLEREGRSRIGETEVAVFDPLEDYTALMEELFDFEALRQRFRGGFRMVFVAMHSGTGPSAPPILE